MARATLKSEGRWNAKREVGGAVSSGVGREWSAAADEGGESAGGVGKVVEEAKAVSTTGTLGIRRSQL